MSYRLGSVPYLNARPLTDWFTETDEGRAIGADLTFAVPSQLAPRLEPGELDAALVSSVAWIRRPQLVFAPGIAIACEGAVHSVRVFSKVPIERIQRVALDTSSLTSVTLTKVLLTERYGLNPRFCPAAPHLDEMLADHDAALLIGDKGYRDYGGDLHLLDLGQEWFDWTGLPFVFAFWIGRPDRLTPTLATHLLQAKEWGMAHRAAIAARRAAEHGESYERALVYVTDTLRFDLGERELAGLTLFAEKVRAGGWL